MSQHELTLLAFDYGSRHIGVAVGQTVTRSASALVALRAKDGHPDWQQVEKLLKEWKPDRLLVGLPLNMDGSESTMSAAATRFGNRLQGRFGVAVAMVDERLSSFEARGEILAETGSRDFKSNSVDSRAAKILLESWLRAQG